eukprot:g28152.t1
MPSAGSQPKLLISEKAITVVDGGKATEVPRSSQNADSTDLVLRINQFLTLRHRVIRCQVSGMSLASEKTLNAQSAQLLQEATQKLEKVCGLEKTLKVNPSQRDLRDTERKDLDLPTLKPNASGTGLAHPLDLDLEWDTEFRLKKLLAKAHPQCPGLRAGGQASWKISRFSGKCAETQSDMRYMSQDPFQYDPDERLANAKPTVNAPKSISQVSQMKLPDLIAENASSKTLLVVAYAKEQSNYARLLAEKAHAALWQKFCSKPGSGPLPVKLVAVELSEAGGFTDQYGVKEVPYCMMFLGGQQVYAKRIHGLRMAPRDAAAAKPKVLLRRLAAGGRLAHFQTQGPGDPRISQHSIEDDRRFDYFTWQPPSSKMQVSNFAQRLQGRRRTFWTKNGPDGVELEEGHRLSINAGVDGKKRHVSLSDAEGNVLVSMSGEVVLDVDEDTAKNLAVEVRNTEINAFGSFSWRFVRLAMLIQLVWQVSKLYLSIAFEQDATVGKVPWARNLLSSLSWSLTGQIVCTEMWCYSLTGEAATVATHVVANLSSTAGIMLVSYFQFSEFFLCFVGAISGLATAPGFQYFNTMDRHPERRRIYDWLVHSKRDAEGLGPLVGDQIYVAAPCLIFSAHGFAEACRLAATLAGAINSGGFAWVPTTCLGIALNLSARLGWSRFALMQITKKLRGGPAAMAIFAPTGWSKFHDELKIYCGYYRFVLVLALCAVRAIIYRSFSAVDAPLAPAFNLSATILIPVLLTAEFIEDHIVTNELLPINPAGPGLLKINAAGDNADPCQLITLEHLPSVAENDPWKMMELQTASRRSKMNFDMSNCEGPPQKTVSLSFSETYVWARLRRWFGQPRSLNSSPALHGLRELPFRIHLSFIGIVAEFTAGLLGLLVGAGYMRGLCPAPLEGMERILGLVTWSVPLPC